MTPNEIEAELNAYIVREVLDGKTDGLESDTPLLEGGIIDSMVMANMLAFIESRFGIDVPPAEVTPLHFESLRAIAALVASLSGEAGGARAEDNHQGA